MSTFAAPPTLESLVDDTTNAVTTTTTTPPTTGVGYPNDMGRHVNDNHKQIETNHDQTESDGIYNLRTNYVAMDISILEQGQRPPQFPSEPNENDDLSSVHTADGIHDMTGFICVCLVILIGDMSRGIFFPSMWPLVESLGGTKVSLGYAVASFSFGRILVNPLFGNWSHHYGYSRTLLLSCCILLLGTFLYAQVQNIGHVEFLIVAQTVLGIGSGTLGVTRAFVADVTARRNRTTYMGLITAVQYGGFTVTPALGALFNRMYFGDDFSIGLFRLNMYTAPAYCMAMIVFFVIVILCLFFRDRERVDAAKSSSTKKTTKRQLIEDYSNEKVALCCGWFNSTIYDLCIIGCMLLNVATKGSIASFETLGIAIADEYFDMSSTRAGLIIAGCGLCGVIALLNLGILERNCSDVHIIAGGMIVMLAGIFGLLVLDVNNQGANQNSNSDWGFVISMFLIYGIGYPVGHTAVIGIFSKIVGRRPQGELLGWFASAGSLARILFPVMSGYIAYYFSMEVLFAVLTGVLFLSTAFILLARRTLTLLST